MRTASLPMYDLPALRRETERWWCGLAEHLQAAGIAGVPARLSRAAEPTVLWRDPDLMFSQTCGYPLTHAFSGRLRTIATPAYRAPGCDGPRYASAILVGARSRAAGLADLRGHVCACNSSDSQSGYNVLRYMLASLADDRPFFRTVLVTGGHAQSAAAVSAGRADVCAIDCVTHALLARHAPDVLAGTRVLTFSPTAPGLPYVTGVGVSNAELACIRTGLAAALADPALAAARAALLIDGIVELPEAAYDEIPAMEAEAGRLGYPELV